MNFAPQEVCKSSGKHYTFIGLTKRFVSVFPYQPEQTFWPIQYKSGDRQNSLYDLPKVRARKKLGYISSYVCLTLEGCF